MTDKELLAMIENPPSLLKVTMSKRGCFLVTPNMCREITFDQAHMFWEAMPLMKPAAPAEAVTAGQHREGA